MRSTFSPSRLLAERRYCSDKGEPCHKAVVRDMQCTVEQKDTVIAGLEMFLLQDTVLAGLEMFLLQDTVGHSHEPDYRTPYHLDIRGTAAAVVVVWQRHGLQPDTKTVEQCLNQ